MPVNDMDYGRWAATNPSKLETVPADSNILCLAIVIRTAMNHSGYFLFRIRIMIPAITIPIRIYGTATIIPYKK